jgi:hypothetical protein
VPLRIPAWVSAREKGGLKTDPSRSDDRVVGLPRYLATARCEDVERTVRLADELLAAHDRAGAVCLLQCGGVSPAAAELGQYLARHGRRVVPLVIRDREQAQLDSTLSKLVGTRSVWVFVEDLLQTFFTVFATQLAFALRVRAKAGFPVIGVGQGALALGGLLLAQRVCARTQFDLVTGLGWAPRVLLDGAAYPDADVASLVRWSVGSLPGLLGIDLRAAGGVRVEGSRVDSVGSEPILLQGGSEDHSLVMLELEPGQSTIIAPPPFAPFDRGLLPNDTLRALVEETSRQRTALPPRRVPVPEPTIVEPEPREEHTRPGAPKPCPMCKRVHAAEPKIELAA